MNYFREWRVKVTVPQSQEEEMKSLLEFPKVLFPSPPLFLLIPWLADPPHPCSSGFPFSNNQKRISNSQQPKGRWSFLGVTKLPPVTQSPHSSETWRVCSPPTGIKPRFLASGCPHIPHFPMTPPYPSPWDRVQTLLPLEPYLMSS